MSKRYKECIHFTNFWKYWSSIPSLPQTLSFLQQFVNRDYCTKSGNVYPDVFPIIQNPNIRICISKIWMFSSFSSKKTELLDYSIISWVRKIAYMLSCHLVVHVCTSIMSSKHPDVIYMSSIYPQQSLHHHQQQSILNQDVVDVYNYMEIGDCILRWKMVWLIGKWIKSKIGNI